MRTTDAGNKRFYAFSIRIALLALLSVPVLPDAAGAQDLRPTMDEAGTRWVNIDRVELGAMDLDTSRFVVLAPGVYQIRTRWRFASTQTSRDGYRYQTSVAVRAIDCRKRQAALIAFADHDGRNVMHTEAQPVYAARWDEVNPESIIDRVATHVCDQRTPETAVVTAIGG
jgi:hypothetical protein